MKKKAVIILFAIIIAVGGVTALGFTVAENLQRTALETESRSLLSAAESSARLQRAESSQQAIENRITGGTTGIDLRQLMRAKGYYEDDITMAAAKLTDVSVYYDMTQAEYDYIVSLVKLGYDPEKLGAIYQFLQLTPDNISILKQIYDTADTEADGPFWIENAYEAVKGFSEQTLSIQEIDAYVKSGISTDDIVQCYQMSLAGTMDIREILDTRKNGASWPQVCERVYGSDELQAADFEVDADIRTIQTFVLMAKRTGSQTKDILEQGSNGVQVKQQILDTLDARRNRVSALQQVLDANPHDKDKLIRVMKEKVGNISDTAAQKLVEEGFRAKEVKEAIANVEAVDGTSTRIQKIVAAETEEVTQQ